MPKITVIPATRDFHTGQLMNYFKLRRVAAYARVSTNSEEQLTSYEAQVDYYTKYIKERNDWEFVKVYTDEGITATNLRKRDGFNEMIEAALAGEIDLIITKSVSRFARNTVDSLTAIRKLKDKGVEVYFEKENIYTLDAKGELLLTIMSSLAQEESRSISQNVTWGIRKSFSDGKVFLPYKHFLGYQKGADGKPEIVPAEAAVIRLIYMLFLEGKTPKGIAKYLTEQGIPTPTGKMTAWQASTIESILTNEKYKGSAILQKTFTIDFLEKKKAVNEGQVTKYYIEDSHEAIIPPGQFEMVQEEIKRRKAMPCKYSGASPFASRLVCADCGSYFGTKVWHSNSPYRQVIYRCNNKYERKGATRCATKHLTEDEIKTAFINAMNLLITNKDSVLEDCRMVFDMLTKTEDVDLEIERQATEKEYALQILKQCIEDNAKKEQDQSQYWKRYDELTERYKQEQTKLEELLAVKEARQHKAELLGEFMFQLHEQEGIMDKFEMRLWVITVENVMVSEEKTLTFEFRNGTIIPIKVA